MKVYPPAQMFFEDLLNLSFKLQMLLIRPPASGPDSCHCGWGKAAFTSAGSQINPFDHVKSALAENQEYFL